MYKGGEVREDGGVREVGWGQILQKYEIYEAQFAIFIFISKIGKHGGIDREHFEMRFFSCHF